MCGIAGYLGTPPPGLLPAMVRVLKHRGPDDEGVHVAPGVGLGMTRLAIIDLETGRQPMSSEDGSLAIVFNGEIYNFRQLRAELESRGRRFRTRSDTEVILGAYAEWGDGCVEHLRGMFAFALWDGPRRRLLLARDRLGKKPLYYWRRDGFFLFASEPKALLCHPAVSRALDWEAFHHYLAFGYTPAERSIFAGIGKVPPASTAVLAEGAMTVHRYWSLPAGQPASPAPRDAREGAARVRHALREAVRLRLESDVPLGVFLSGGVDSSAIVASMREVTGQRIATFSIGFGPTDPSYDELPRARLVARRFATDHHEEVLEPRVADLLPAVVEAFDEPFADSSAIPTFVVAQATARHVKVVLSGIGGDETFGGYPRYLGVRVSEAYGRLPGWLRAIPDALLSLVPESESSRNWGDWARRFVAAGGFPLPDRYIGWTRFFDERALARLVTGDVRHHWRQDVEALARETFAGHGHGDPMDGAFRIDLGTYLPDDLLVMADRMSMAHSLELRAPFCDHRLIEESLAIPPSMKVPGSRLKGLLKTAFAEVLPPEILSRPKQGFMIPLGRWLRTDLRPMLDDLLSPSAVRARGLYDPAVVERLKQEHGSGARSHSDRLWTLMIGELWMRQYLDTGSPWSLGGLRPRAPLRVLMVSDVSPVTAHGGAERVLWEEASGLAGLGHRVTILSRAPEVPAEATLEREGVRILHYPVDRRSSLRFFLGSILAARRAAASALAEADVLHVHQPLSGYGALASPAGRRIPSLYSFHSPAALEYRWRRGMTAHHRGGWAGTLGELALGRVERACLRRATRIHVLSDFSAGQLWTLHRVPRERIVKVPGGADLLRFAPAPDRARVRAALGLPPDRPLLFTVRTLEARMGLDTLIRAMALVRQRVPGALLLLGGSGTLRPELEALAGSLGLADHVRFLGFVPEDDLPRYYQAADLFVLPTRALEGFGLVTVEALACGTPVVGTSIGATPEILSPLSASLIFRGLAPEIIAEDLAGILDGMRRDPAWAARLREACRRHAETGYAWTRSITMLEDLLRRLVDGSVPRLP
ncbi:MAG: asparagine synthase (glutamine-hydrolyzing) [Candidatus Rokubacteria bacterium]|nr:asparagine synthase (glutamine-hydrolyzing) [Candidatus Rokubacteria bacterium]